MGENRVGDGEEHRGGGRVDCLWLIDERGSELRSEPCFASRAEQHGRANVPDLRRHSLGQLHVQADSGFFADEVVQ